MVAFGAVLVAGGEIITPEAFPAKAALVGASPKAGRAAVRHEGVHAFESRPAGRDVEDVLRRRHRNGERARPGRGFPRPRGKPTHTDGFLGGVFKIGKSSERSAPVLGRSKSPKGDAVGNRRKPPVERSRLRPRTAALRILKTSPKEALI